MDKFDLLRKELQVRGSSWPGAAVPIVFRKRPMEKMEVRRRSAMRDLSPKAATGQLRPVANHRGQSSGRLLYFGSCRKANSHYSARAVAGDLIPRLPQWIRYRNPAISGRSLTNKHGRQDKLRHRVGYLAVSLMNCRSPSTQRRPASCA